MNLIKASILTSVLAMGMSSAQAQQVIEHDGTPAQLVELFTSEGCSSCPPADRYLSSMVESPALWNEILPLAFHVDYWDYIGWKDRFAQPAFKQRQYDYRRAGNIRSVYTPGWVVDGLEWRGFFSRQPLPPKRQAEGGNLKAVIDQQKVNVQYQPVSVTGAPRLTAHIAILGFDLSSKVTRGENRGRVLKHQFVVLDKQQKPQTDYQWQFDLPTLDQSKRHGIAIWITQRGQRPIQATGNWLTFN